MDNFCPISFISIFSNVLKNRLMQCFEKYANFNFNQFRFRPALSNTKAIVQGWKGSGRHSRVTLRDRRLVFYLVRPVKDVRQCFVKVILMLKRLQNRLSQNMLTFCTGWNSGELRLMQLESFAYKKKHSPWSLELDKEIFVVHTLRNQLLWSCHLLLENR